MLSLSATDFWLNTILAASSANIGLLTFCFAYNCKPI